MIARLASLSPLAGWLWWHLVPMDPSGVTIQLTKTWLGEFQHAFSFNYIPTSEFKGLDRGIPGKSNEGWLCRDARLFSGSRFQLGHNFHAPSPRLSLSASPSWHISALCPSFGLEIPATAVMFANNERIASHFRNQNRGIALWQHQEVLANHLVCEWRSRMQCNAICPGFCDALTKSDA